MSEKISISKNQLFALEAFNQLKFESDEPNSIINIATLEFKNYFDEAEIGISCSKLLELKKMLANIGLKIPKLEKRSYTCSSQYADGHDENHRIHVHVFPKRDTFEGCKVVEEKVPVEIPEHVVAAQPAREAIPEHVEPAHTEYKTVKTIKCGNQ